MEAQGGNWTYNMCIFLHRLYLIPDTFLLGSINTLWISLNLSKINSLLSSSDHFTTGIRKCVCALSCEFPYQASMVPISLFATSAPPFIATWEMHLVSGNTGQWLTLPGSLSVWDLSLKCNATLPQTPLNSHLGYRQKAISLLMKKT